MKYYVAFDGLKINTFFIFYDGKKNENDVWKYWKYLNIIMLYDLPSLLDLTTSSMVTIHYTPFAVYIP